MDLSDLLKQAQALQSRLAEQRAQAGAQTISAEAGGGMVTATVNGRGEIASIRIEPQAVDPRDVPMLQDLIVAAVRAAQTKAREQEEQAMGPLAGVMRGDFSKFPFGP